MTKPKQEINFRRIFARRLIEDFPKLRLKK